jgi:alpha-tubulin suppressor-like RCC1 family protein
MPTNAKHRSRARQVGSSIVLVVMLIALTGCRTSIFGWGFNGSGQIGDGTTAEKHAPTALDTDVEHAPWKTIAAGADHNVAVLTDGELWAWGKNNLGQVGNGTTATASVPKAIVTTINWTMAVAGGDHSLAIKSDGTLWAWGDNAFGQLGDGTTTNRLVPVQVGAAITWKTVATSAGHTLGVSTAGKLYAWGKNNTGQIGDGTLATRLVPTLIGAVTTWKTVAAGGQHSLAVRTDGSLWGWGDNSSGQVGDSTFTNRSTPTRIGTAVDWTTIAAGNGHSIAIRTGGTLWTWGYNNWGQLGDGTTASSAVPAQIAPNFFDPSFGGYLSQPGGWTSIAAGLFHTVAANADGSLAVWGDATAGQLGNGSTAPDSNRPRVLTTPVTEGQTWSAVSAGSQHTIALQTGRSLWGFGANNFGQLGDATGVDHHSPVEIAPINDWKDVAVGGSHTIAVGKDGSLWAWGDNTYGQVGDGTTTNRSRPVRLGSSYSWKAVAAGDNHSLAITNDGALYSWGNNTYGQLGLSDTVDRHAPVIVECSPAFHDPSAEYCGWSFIAAGGNSSGGQVAGDRGLRVFGDNRSGQLGINTTQYPQSDFAQPMFAWRVGHNIAADFVSFSMGKSYGIAIDTFGNLYTWGYNGTGALGDGTVANHTVPVLLGTDTWTAVDAGSYHTLAIRSDGTLWAWGDNSFGELGDGTHTQRRVPTQIPLSFGFKVKAVSAGAFDSALVGTDGTLYAWGQNSAGQLGDGSTVDHAFPTQIGTETKWVDVSVGSNTVMALHS